MSNVVDQRILEMQFDNKQFEQGVSTSLKTLEDLKKGLNLDKAAKGLEGLKKAGKNFSLDGMANNVNFVAQKFTALGIAGITAMQRITNAALTAGKNLVKAFTLDPITSGLREYETQIGAIQTILSNTKSKGSTLDDVNRSLDELNTYADKTIYNFTEMAKNIGTFTAAGVALDTSTAAIKGVANLAAVSGSNAQQASVAMYQLSQALASGTIRLMDWNSVVNAGMGGEVFQNALKETARLHGIKIDEMIKKEGSFRETLQNGWLTASILTETLSKFTGDLTESEILAMGYTKDQAKAILELGKDASDAATKVKTFTQLMDTLKEALGSGWAQTWENVIGNFEEARTLWTSVSDALGGIISKNAEARNDLLAGWKDAGGRDDLLKGLTDVFEALWSIVVAVGDAMDDIFPDTTVDQLLALSKGVKDFGHNLRVLFNYIDYTNGEYTTNTKVNPLGPLGALGIGSKGDDVKDLQRKLKEAGATIEEDGIFGKKTENALKEFQKKQGILADGILGPETRKALFGDETIIEKIAKTTAHFSEKLKQLQSIAGGVFAIFDIGLKVLGFFWEVIKIVGDVLSPIADMFLAIAAAIGDWFIGIDEGMKTADPFVSWLELVRTLLAPVKDLLTLVTSSILSFFGIGDAAKESSSGLQTFSDWWEKIKQSIESTGIIDKLKAITDAVRTFLFGSKDNIRTGETGQPNLIERVVDFFDRIKEWYSKSEEAQAFVEKLKAIFQTVKEFLFGSKDNIRTGEKGQPNLIERVMDFFDRIKEWYSKSEEAQAFVEKLKEIFASIREFLFGTKDDVRTGEKGKPNLFQRIDDFFGWIGDMYDTLMKNEKVKAVVDAIKNFFKPVIQAIKDFFSTDDDKTEKDPEEKGKNILDPFIRVYEWIKQKWEEISQWFANAFKDADQFLNNVGTGGLVGILLAGFGLLGIVKTVKSVKNVAKGLGDVIDIFKNKFKSGIKVQPISKSILQIAFAIGLLVAAIYVLGTRSGPQLAQGAITLGVIVGVLVTLVALMNKFTKVEQAGNIEKVGQAFLNFAIAIGIIAAAIFVLGNKDLGVLLRGGGAIVVILGILTVFAFFMKKYGSTEMNYKGLVGMAFAIGILGIVAWMLGKMGPKSLWSGIGALVGLMVALSVFMAIVNRIGGASDVSYKGLFSMVLAVGVMAGLIVLLSKVVWKEGWKGALALGVLMAALATFMWFVNKKGGSSTVKYGGLIAMSAAIGILAGIVMMLGGMDQGAMWRGVAAVVILMGAMAGLMAILGLTTKNITPATIVQTLVVVLGFIALITAFSIAVNLIRNVDPLTMVAFAGSFALALAALVGAILVITKTKMSVGSMAKGAAGLGTAISVLVLMITALVAGLGEIDKLANGGLVAALERGGVVLREVGRAVGLLISGVKEGVLGINSGDETPEQLQEKNKYLGDITSAIDGLKGALIALGAILGGSAILGLIPGGAGAIIKGAFGISVALLEISLAVTGIVWALGFIDQVSDKSLTKTIEDGAGVLSALGLAIGALLGGIKEGFLYGTGGYAGYIKNVQDYATALNELSASIKNMTSNPTIESDTNKAILISRIVKGFFDAMTMYPINFKALVGYATAPGQLATDMASFATTITIFSVHVKTLGNPVELLLNTTKAILVAGIVYGFFKSLEGYPVYKGLPEGYYTAPDELSTDMTNFSDSITKFAEAVKKVAENQNVKDDTDSAIDIATKVKSFFDSIAGKTINPLGLMFYNSVAKSFLSQMQTLGTTIADYGTELSGIAKSTIEADSTKALAVAGAIRDFLSSLNDVGIEPYRGAIQKFLYGSTTNETILDQMGVLGQKMLLVKDGFSGLGGTNIVEDVGAGTTAAKAIAEFLTFVSSDAVNLKDFDPSTGILPAFSVFSIQMTALAQAIKDFDTTTAGVDVSRFATFAWGIGAIGKALSETANLTNTESFTAFKTAVNDFITILSGTMADGTKLDSSHFLDGLDSKDITSKLETFATTVSNQMIQSSDTILTYTTKFDEAGQSLANNLNNGVNAAETDTSGIDTMIGQLLAATNPYLTKFESVGKNFGLSMSAGLRKSAAVAVAMAQYVAQKMLEKVKEVFKINSPSKEGISIGKSLDEGLAEGVSTFASMAVRASEKTGSSMLDSTRETLSGLSAVLDGSMDGPPVIRPILDLTDVTSGAKRIGGLFSGQQTVSVGSMQSRALAASIRMPGSSPAINQNGSQTPNKVGAAETSKFDFTNAQFHFSDKLDVRAWKMELDSLARDEDRAKGSVY